MKSSMVAQSASLHQLPAELEALAGGIVLAMQKEAARYTATGAAPQIELAGVLFTQVIDPFSRQPAYEGVWRNVRHERCGIISFNSDYSFFAEYDLFCPHPRDARWFVEMVTAWGSADSLRCEAKLIPNP